MGRPYTEAVKRAQARYNKANTRQIILKLNLNTDGDILEVLDRVGNKQGYIKALIRADAARGAITPEE